MLRRSIVAALAVLAACATVSTASAGGGTSVKGTQTPVASGVCYDPAALASYAMTGSLVGCWYVDTEVLDALHPSGTIKVSGTEHFAGCLDRDGDGTCGGDDAEGTFSTTFTFTGKYDASFNELHGRCHHPIISGTGGFATVSGVIDFVDDVTTGCARYTGSIRI